MVASIVDDDLKFSTCGKLYDEIISTLVKKFQYTDKCIADWFLGMKILQNAKSISFDQQDYCKSIIDSIDLPI